MPKLKNSLRFLIKPPLGQLADGRPLGLGLATAMAKQRELMIDSSDADRHLRRWAADESLKAGR
ncbi:hypothetical protein [Streptosporangium sp. KLBMP 9127]|nr:hypothetical protein [Streptosporangium sp. KLBMP 9127]